MNDTNETNEFALARMQPNALGKALPNAKLILSGMVADTLALATKHQFTEAHTTYRIGDYEFCEPDYRQIHVWADQLRLPPMDVVNRLNPQRVFDESDWGNTTFSNGRIRTLRWDFELLPLKSFEWAEHLQLTHLDLISRATFPLDSLEVNLPSLLHFRCNGVRMMKLDITRAARLESLDLGCSGTGLSELPLDGLRNLTTLTCRFGRLAQLNLMTVPNLLHLVCGGNELTNLNLSNVPKLQSLSCYNNRITALDLSCVKDLFYLSVNSNPMSVIDIRPLSKLKVVFYDKDKVRLIQREDQHFER